MQLSNVDAPGLIPVLPVGHARQSLLLPMPAKGLNLPGVQSSQVDVFVAPSSRPNLPFSHLMHFVLSPAPVAFDQVPKRHLLHPVTVMMPRLLLHLPGGHFVQFSALVAAP